MSRDSEGFDEIRNRIIRIDQTSDRVGASSEMGRRQTTFGPPGTLNSVTPCAACKLLRRRCAEECPFSPYFSPQEPQKFAAVHRVFGASNVSKMLLELPESQRADAANSLVYEANLRIRDPVYGCMGLISTLQQQIQTLQAELNAVRTELLKYRYKEAASHLVSSTLTTHSHAALVSPHGLVSIASLPQAIMPDSSPPPPPPPPPSSRPPPPSRLISSSSTSSTSSLYTPSTNTTGYSSISSDNVPYFD